MSTIRELFEKYAPAVAYIAVESADGTQSIGSAFHVGEGVFVTARHVVEHHRILEICTTVERGATGIVKRGPFFHPNPKIDVAALVVDGIDSAVIPLGGHLDDWINDSEFLLREVLVLGYPRIPLADKPVLVASRAEVNAIVDQIDCPHPRFLVSTMARGGFSGGPCLIEWDFALGVITHALIRDHGAVESGFMTVISVEPILQCLAAHHIMPQNLLDLWDGLFTQNTRYFGKPELSWAQASIVTDRDGKRSRLQFDCPSAEAIEEANAAIRQELADVPFQYGIREKDIHEFDLLGDYASMGGTLELLASTVQRIFEKRGFLSTIKPKWIARTLNESEVHWFGSAGAKSEED